MTMMLPRVLIVCHGHPAFVPGGTEWVAHDLFGSLSDRGVAQALFLGCVSPLHRLGRLNTRFQTVDRSSDELLLWVAGFDRFMLAQNEPLSFVDQLEHLLCEFRPHIVHFHHFSRIGLDALAVVRRTLPNARIVVTLHDYHLICANEGLMQTPAGIPCRRASTDACHRCLPEIARHRFAARSLYIRSLLSLVDQFISPSVFLRDRFVEWGIPRRSIRVIANALKEVPAPVAAPERPRQTFGFFGNVSPHKGILLALAAVRRLAGEGVDCEFRIHGDVQFQPEGFRAAFAQALADAAPVACHTGPYLRDDLPRLMSQVDWVVVPSTWWENAPLVILEAFQNRRPVICSDIGGMAEMVQDGINGLHFQSANEISLASIMRRATGNQGLWTRLSAAIPPVPTVAEAADRHLALYNSLLRSEEAISA